MGARSLPRRSGREPATRRHAEDVAADQDRPEVPFPVGERQVVWSSVASVAAVAASHLPGAEVVESWPKFTADSPLRVLVSGCLSGARCGADGSSYGAPYAHIDRLLGLANVRPTWFCPEDWAFGTPREVPDIHGGNGFDVVEGRAKVLSSSGIDWTDKMLAAAETMLDTARRDQVRVALLMDISAACGSQVIYVGNRSDGVYQRGPGVCAALLVRNGIPVLSQRDFRSLGLLIAHVDPTYVPDGDARDHHESDWYRSTFPP